MFSKPSWSPVCFLAPCLGFITAWFGKPPMLLPWPRLPGKAHQRFSCRPNGGLPDKVRVDWKIYEQRRGELQC